MKNNPEPESSNGYRDLQADTMLPLPDSIGEEQLCHCARLLAAAELVTGVAHGTANVLMGVSATLDLLLMRMTEEASLADLVDVVTSVYESSAGGVEALRRLQSFVNAHPSAIRRTAPGSAIESAVALCSAHPSARKVGVVSECPDSCPDLCADEAGLVQVLVILMLNALRASKSGTVRVGARESSEEPLLEIYVADNGCGIAPEDMPKIFTPFFSNWQDGDFSAGLGLYCAKRTLGRMSGTIKVTSQPGQGSTFTLRLPKWSKIGGMEER